MGQELPALDGHVQYETFGYPDTERTGKSWESFFQLQARASGRLYPGLSYKLEALAVADSADFTAGAFSWRNAGTQRPYLSLQTAAFDYRPLSNLRLRLGKQVVSWSIFDELQPANVMNPQDGSDVFRRSDVGIYGLSARGDTDLGFAEVMVAPFVFVLPRFPQGRWNIIPGKARRKQEDPPVQFEETQVAARVGTQVGGLDVSAFGYIGRDWAAVFQSELVFVGGSERFQAEVTTLYPNLRAGGISASYPLGESVLVRTEIVYFGSPDAFRENFLLGAIGLEYTWNDWRLNVSYLRNDQVDAAQVEVTEKGERQFFQSFLSGEWRYDAGGRLNLQLRGGYDFTEEIYLLQPEISYRIWGDLRAALTAEIIDGKRFGYFHRIRHEDRIGTRLRYHF